jgi:hypothetical protein
MPDAQQVEVYNPQGKLGTIPSAQLDQAKAAGYKPKADFMEAVHPKTGQTGIIPKEQWDAAQKQGYVLSPREQQRAKAKAGAVIKPDEGGSLAVAMQGTGAPGITVTKTEDVAGVRAANKKLGAVTAATVGGEVLGPVAAKVMGAAGKAFAPTVTSEAVPTGIFGPTGEEITREAVKYGPSAANKLLKTALPKLIKRAIGSYGAYEVAKKLGVPLP